MTDYPNDADGDVFRSLAAKGVDLTQPRLLEFYCYAATVLIAQKISEKLTALGFKCDIFEDDQEETPDDARISVYAERVMVPSYQAVTRVQDELNILLKEFDTYCDGWATTVDPSERKSN
jgi:hypothetical protein